VLDIDSHDVGSFDASDAEGCGQLLVAAGLSAAVPPIR
jgi:putative methionine-R-sulfoxide reductase with GAF domain